MVLSERERPAGIQLFGNDPADFDKAVRFAMRFSPDFIDINMGCPAPKVTKNGAGSSLLKDAALCGRITAAAVKASDVPVTVKIRKGWDNTRITAAQVAKQCEENGAAAVTVHGRTREQMYAPPVDMDIIRAVKTALRIPVIGNGDVTDGQSAAEMYKYTNCDLIAVGRGALGRPWVFAQINAYMTGVPWSEPDIRTKMDVMLAHAAKICAYKGERIGMNEARKHAIWYTKGLRGKAELRRRMSEITSLAELQAVAREIISQNT